MKRTILFALLMLAGVGISYAQRVTGRVTSKDDGAPVSFATVTVKGFPSAVTTTNDNGEYSITVPTGGKTLNFSFMGMKDIDVDITGRSVVNAEMESDAMTLTETVVTAMGIKKERKALGYAVQDLKASELMKNKQANVVNALAGKIPGVNITQSGGAAGAGSNITIRGGNSASESRDNQPLFVVDGIIYDNSTINSGSSGTDGVTKSATTFSNRVMDVNPEDIESMSVLKGAAAAALYGSRAADGVVIITTKKGAEGAARVNFSSKYTYSWIKGTQEQQSTYGRGSYNAAGTFTDLTMSSWNNTPISGEVYDNIGGLFQGSNIFDNSVSISGGGKNNSFFLSASNFNQTSVISTNKYDRTTFRFNGEQKYGILTLGANATYSQANTTKTLTSAGLYNYGGTGAMVAGYLWPRSDDMTHYLNDDGTKYRMFEGRQELASDTENPYWIINKNELTDATSRFTGALNASVKIADWWDVTARAGIDEYTTKPYTYIAPQAAVKEMYQKGSLSKGISSYQYVTTNVMSNFHKQLGDFDFGLLLGFTTEATKRTNNSMWGYTFIQDIISFASIAQNNKQFTDRTTQKRMAGMYGEFRAAYKNIAYLTVTGRNDWSSTLPVDNRSYFYPSVSGSFVFTELLPKNSILNFGKIRASWAQVGKDADPYALEVYSRAIATLNGGKLGTGDDWTAGSVAKPLKPEQQKAYEFGVELKFLNGRLGLDYTYYNSKTEDQICAPRLAQSTGFIFITQNGGSVTNKGMELMITGKPIVTKDFTWEATLNLSGNRNRLGKFVAGVDIFYVTDAQMGGIRAGSIPNGGYFLGLIGDVWNRETGADGKEIAGGRYQFDQTTGLYKVTTANSTVVGNREPDMIGGFNNSLTYKNFNLSFLFDIRFGGMIYNGTDYYLTRNGMAPRTATDRNSVTFTSVVNTGTSANPVWEDKTTTYEAGKTYNVNGASRSGSYMIQQYWTNYSSNAYNFMTDTNWLRLRSISLSYDFKNLIKGQNIIKGLTATVTGTNLWLLTNYDGPDPETASAGSGTGGSGSVGIDYCGVPSTAGISFGVNLTF